MKRSLKDRFWEKVSIAEKSIRNRLLLGESLRSIAKTYKVDKSLILRIKQGRTYNSVSLGG